VFQGGDTALITAAQKGHLPVVEGRFWPWACTSADKKGFTALHSVTNGHVAIVEALLVINLSLANQVC
jgi:hypothetical protein